ncbi:MAG: VCBS repeat-containing protein [Planctomycetaceae bacterium]|nr:VCBS repeat-containing protein [Planctomycetaceae bacterium]
MMKYLITQHNKLPNSTGFRCSHFSLWLGLLAPLLIGCQPASTKPAASPQVSSPQVSSPQVSLPSNRGLIQEATADRSVVPLRTMSKTSTEIDLAVDREAPSQDSWDTEIVSEQISSQLARLTALLASPKQEKEASELLADKLEATRLYPEQMSETYRDKTIVLRAAENLSPALVISNRDDFLEAFDGLARELNAAGPPSIKFKLIKIDAQGGEIVTELLYEASSRGADHSRQQRASWECRWRASSDSGPPLLSAVRVSSFAEAEYQSPSGTLFRDVTAAVMSANDAYARQVLPGINDWSKRLGREFMGQFGHHGLAVADVNNDGLDDLYVCDAGGLPNRLYVQNSDGTIRDVSAESGVDFLDESFGALLVDLDNDGDQDLVVACDLQIQIAENDGNGQFQLKQAFIAETDSYSISAADFNQDSKLDIYLCGYNARRQTAANRGLPFPLPYYDANNGGRNYLLKNCGEFEFVDVTADVGLDENNQRFSLAAAWEDYDDDGDLDLYVANDFGRNNLFRNEGGRFTDVAAAANVEDHASGMSVSWGDYDRDGAMDVYVSNMFSAAGNRISFQQQFSDGIQEEAVGFVQRMARGNTLFRNQQDGSFQDVSEMNRVTMGRWAWASRFADLNNDGWLDLIVANGYVTNDDSGDL